MKTSALVCVLVVCLACGSSQGNQKALTKRPLCDFAAKQSAGCLQTLSASRKLDCARRCLENPLCDGFVYVLDSCYSFKASCPSPNGGCTVGDEGIEYFSKNAAPGDCLNGGVVNDVTGTCDCNGGWVGRQCELLAVSCQQLFEEGYPNEKHRVTLDVYGNGSVLIQNIECVVREYSQTIVFYSSGQTFHFNRTMDDFINGYFVTHDDFWMGLESMYHLAAAGHDIIKVSVQQQDENEPSKSNIFRRYDGFTMGDSNTGYAFNFTSSEVGGNGVWYEDQNAEVGDCLLESRGVPFSAPDTAGAGGYATMAGTGWWFPVSGAVTCHPLGLRYSSRSEPWTEQHVMITGVDMKDTVYYGRTYMYFRKKN